MSRNSSGTYSLPAGQPVVAGTTIDPAVFNTLTSDIGTELTDSLDRSGKGAMLAALQLADGAVGAPGLTFGADTDTGIYRVGSGDLAITLNNAKYVEFTTAATTLAAALAFSGTASVSATSANSTLTLVGNRSAADAGTDLVLNSTATRTAGKLVDVQTNAVSVLSVDFAGQVKWPSGPASTATTPAPSALTAITPNANWGSTSTFYWKDPLGMVHMKGRITNAGAGANPAFTLPAGFRPSGTTRSYITMNSNSLTGLANIVFITITTAGAVSFLDANAGAAAAGFIDCVHFLAEA